TWRELVFILSFVFRMFVIHLISFALWYIGFNPVMLFIVLYAVMALYYIGRYLYKRYLINKIKERLQDENITRVLCLPTLHFNQWRVVAVTEQAYYVGRTFKGQVVFYDRFEKIGPLEGELFQAVKD